VIYATAHVVRARRFESRIGANAFLHRPAGDLPRDEDLRSALERVGHAPGQISGCSIEIPPGGNEVESFLDLLFAEEVTLSNALARVRHQLESTDSLDTVARLDSQIIFRFHVSPRIERWSAFDRLQASLLDAARSPRPSPLKILLERTHDLLIFRLDSTSKERLRKLHGTGWSGDPLKVHFDVADGFEAARGSLLPHVIEVVAGLGRKHLEGLGGIVVETHGGEQLLQWAAADWMKS
jgi:hypothetical protein